MEPSPPPKPGMVNTGSREPLGAFANWLRQEKLNNPIASLAARGTSVNNKPTDGGLAESTVKVHPLYHDCFGQKFVFAG